MIDDTALEAALSELPLYVYFFVDPKSLEFSGRIRHICRSECPMYGKSWACPPAVGEVSECERKCLSYSRCLMIGTITECDDAADIQKTLATRAPHEKLTNKVGSILKEMGIKPYILSTEACDECARCAFLDGLPCRLPGRMHPCVESHGINLVPTLEQNGLDFIYSDSAITWYSLLFFNG